MPRGSGTLHLLLGRSRVGALRIERRGPSGLRHRPLGLRRLAGDHTRYSGWIYGRSTEEVAVIIGRCQPIKRQHGAGGRFLHSRCSILVRFIRRSNPRRVIGLDGRGRGPLRISDRLQSVDADERNARKLRQCGAGP
jgi:hypothetical protein